MKRKLTELTKERKFMSMLMNPKQFMVDVNQLASDLVVFEMKYGVKVELVFDDLKPKQ